MKTILLLFAYTCCSLLTFAQSFRGKVTDETGTPIPYANIVLQQAADSSFVTGTISDEQGDFTLQADAENHALLLKVSFIGYLTQTIPTNNGFEGTIRLKSESQSLGEVVVKGHKSVYSMKNGILKTQVNNTILKEFGTAFDVLKQLPLVTNKDKELEVMGRGTPAIYINNRLVRNNNELDQLRSDQIKDVQVILNPGSRYDAETKSVIKITTLRRDEGFGGNLSLYGVQRRNFAHEEQLDLMYRKGKLDVSTMLYWNQEKLEQKQTTTTAYTYHAQSYQADEIMNLNKRYKDLEFSGILNYSLTDKQDIGMKYTLTKGLPTHTDYNTETSFRQGDKTSNFQATNFGRMENHSHYVNAYYQNQLEKASINLDGTFMRNSNSENMHAWNNMDGTETTIPSESSYQADLYALKAWSELEAGGGNLEVGAEGTQTETDQNYRMLNQDIAENLPSTLSQSDQTAVAVFANYARSWNNFSVSGGLRYEYVNYDYRVDGVKQPEQSKTYHNLCPTLSLNYSKDPFNASFTYRTMLYRPTYSMLSSNIVYDNVYMYEGGNPSLKHSLTHWLDLLLTYKDWQADVSYYYQKDGIMSYMEHYKDLPVILFSTINQDQSAFLASLSYSPTIGWWKPSFSANLTNTFLTYAGRTYNNPYFAYAWRNTFTFPHAWLLNIALSGNAQGEKAWMTQRANFRTDLFIKKNFGKTIEVSAGVDDIFNTYRNKWYGTIADITTDKWNNPDYRKVYMKVVVKLNSFRNKYKGGTSGAAERRRM